MMHTNGKPAALLDSETARRILCWLVRGANLVRRGPVLQMQGLGMWEQLAHHPWFQVTAKGLLTWSEEGKRILDAMPHGGQRAPR